MILKEIECELSSIGRDYVLVEWLGPRIVCREKLLKYFDFPIRCKTVWFQIHDHWGKNRIRITYDDVKFFIEGEYIPLYYAARKILEKIFETHNLKALWIEMYYDEELLEKGRFDF